MPRVPFVIQLITSLLIAIALLVALVRFLWEGATN